MIDFKNIEYLRTGISSIAPCGVMCDICLAYQRKKNKCVGCLNKGNKPYHCTVCSIKSCEEKKDNEEILCYECRKFPCRRIKDLEKRYRLKYGVSLIQNLNSIKEIGLDQFIENEKEKWKCTNCGQLLCVHSEFCLNCENKNGYFPANKDT
jgi:hypothetical protein